jgi:cysteine-rich repeat protein
VNLAGPYCGDSIRNATEACDDGNNTTETACDYGTRSCARCDASCSTVLNLTGHYCGDNTVNGPEVCDDGNNTTEASCAYGTQSCVRCDASCSTVLNLTGPYCGDNVRNGPEACDDGNNTTESSCPYGIPSCTACDATCANVVNPTGPFCGDGIRNGYEACDDDNTDACGTCSANCLQNQLTPARGSIEVVSVSNIRDGTDTIILNDGVNPAVIFEFDLSRTSVPAPDIVPIPYSSGDSRAEMAASLAAAINAATAPLNLSATTSGVIVNLTHDSPGAFGNRTISTTARTSGPSASLRLSGMSGGGGFDCPAGTGCSRSEDCASSVCIGGTCQ